MNKGRVKRKFVVNVETKLRICRRVKINTYDIRKKYDDKHVGRNK